MVIRRVGNFLLTHKKKMAVLVGASIWGTRYAMHWYEDETLWKEYFNMAKKFGDVTIKSSVQPRKVLVLVNPSAKGRKCLSEYRKNVEPMLILAGHEVELVETEYEGQGKEYMSVLDSGHAECVLLAGGNGTILELVTGLMRKRELMPSVANIPVGIIPLGQRNTLAKHIFKHVIDKGRGQELLAEASLSVLTGKTDFVSFMYVEGDEPSEEAAQRNAYSMAELKWGQIRNCQESVKRYWMFGPLRSELAFIWSSLMIPWPPNVSAQLQYTLPCSGCARCIQEQTGHNPASAEHVIDRYWWGTLKPKNANASSSAVQSSAGDNQSTEMNELCGVWHTEHISCSQVEIHTPHSDICETPSAPSCMRIRLFPADLTRMEYIRFGMRAHDNRHIQCERIREIEAGQVRLVPDSTAEPVPQYFIDGDKFGCIPITASLLQNKLKVFVSAPDKNSIPPESDRRQDPPLQHFAAT